MDSSLSHVYQRNKAAFEQILKHCGSLDSTSTSPTLQTDSSSQVSTVKVQKRQWLRLLSSYYMDVSSGNESVAFTTLSNKISIKFVISIDKVLDILDRCDKAIYPLIDHALIIGDMVPKQLKDELVETAGKEQFEALCTRYYPMLLTDGLFLSTDSRLLKALEKSSKRQFIECYASPFNNNARNYCSLFREDRNYGALPRFDEFIEYINYPCRLYANPPYTPEAMKVCIDCILEYMSRQKGEFICLLPIMYNYEPLDRLLMYPSTHSAVLKAGEYTLYSFTTDKIIVASMDLQIVVNVYDDPEGMIDTIVEKMKEYALEVHSDTKRERKGSFSGSLYTHEDSVKHASVERSKSLNSKSMNSNWRSPPQSDQNAHSTHYIPKIRRLT